MYVFLADPSYESTSSVSSSQSSPSGTFMDMPLNSTSTTPPGPPQTTVRRGPGRPRLKPGGPSNAGSRGTYRPRKPARPLPVPLPSDGNNSSSTNNAQYSSYSFYDFHDD